MSISSIDPLSLRALLDSETIHACIDVRERGEFAQAQIPGSSPVNRGALEVRLPIMVPDKRVPVVVCCDNGRRSSLAAQTLNSMGYSNVQVLNGGLDQWKQQGLAVRSGWGVHGKEYGEQVAHNSNAVIHLSAIDLARRRKTGDDIVVVDVRSREEYLRGHVPDTFHIPGGNLPLDAPRLPLADSTTLVVSCAGRTRGILGAKILHDSGFKNVFALENGVMGWFLAGGDIASGPGKELRENPAPGYQTRIQEATAKLATQEGIRSCTQEAFGATYNSSHNFYLLDVRLPEEYETDHIPRSISLPLGQMALTHDNFLAVRKAPVFVVSDDDLRAVWAVSLLNNLGFHQATVLDGGIPQWRKAGLPLESGIPQPTVFSLKESRVGATFVDPSALQTHLQSSSLALDVRSIGEYGFAHIPGTQWLPRGRLELDIQNVAPQKTKPLVVICDNGIRSTLAARTLRILGHTDIRILQGGTQAWESAGLEVEDGLEGTDVSIDEAQADFGHSLWSGALGKSREDMKRYLSWEIDLVKNEERTP